MRYFIFWFCQANRYHRQFWVMRENEWQAEFRKFGDFFFGIILVSGNTSNFSEGSDFNE